MVLSTVFKVLQVTIYSVLIFADMHDSFEAHTLSKMDWTVVCLNSNFPVCSHSSLRTYYKQSEGLRV